MAKYAHLTLEDRFEISKLLDTGASIKLIGSTLNKDCTTFSKEIRRHFVFKKIGAHGRAFNECSKRRGCDYRRLCPNCRSSRFCWSCQTCNLVCPDFHKEHCDKLSRPPYVCNGCVTLKSCTLEKRFYQATVANTEYRLVLSESRQGIFLSEAEIAHLDHLISPLIRKGQSLNHICINIKDSIMVSESTIYRPIDYNAFSARNIDLSRKERYSVKVDKSCRINRTYQDYMEFRMNHPDLPITQIDSVEGTKGGKLLLTIHFVKAEFTLALLRDTNDSQSVINLFERLYLELLPDLFMQIMPVLLGDNGSEFSNPKAIEFDRQ